MTDLSRHPTRPRPARELRHLVIGLALLATASLVWHAARDYAVRELAQSSLGCQSRAHLVAAAIRHRHPALAPETRYVAPPLSYRTGAATGAVFSVAPAPQPSGAGTLQGSAQRYGLVNASLDLVGVFAGCSLPILPLPGDRDGDGQIETIVSCTAEGARRAALWATVRLGADSNQIGGVTLVDYARWSSANAWIRPEWGDEDGDGRQELVFLAWTSTRLPSGRRGWSSFRTIATFEWSASGGILRPKMVPDDGSFLVWTPADGKPYPFPQDESVADIARKLLPIPDDFGVPATAPAAAQPATRPAAEPGYLSADDTDGRR